MLTKGSPAISNNARQTVVQKRPLMLWVLRFDSAASKPNGANADGVIGQADFSGRSAATTAQGLSRPDGLAVDGSGRLWVADTFNNRVLLFEAAGVPTATATATPTATPTPTSTPIYTAGTLTFAGVVGLPAGYQSAKLQTNRYITSPSGKATSPVYQSQTVQHGSTVGFSVGWPGIDAGDTLVHVYIGSVLLDPLTQKPISGTSKSFSEHWNPRVCPAP